VFGWGSRRYQRAFEETVPAEIHALTEKASPADADELLLEDSAASYAKKRTTWADVKTALGSVFSATAHTHAEADITDLDHFDASAIHDDETGEVHALTEKASPADADELLLEDSAASYAKKRTTWGDVKTALGSVFSATGHTHAEADITDLDHFDASAIHDDETGEIHAVAAKTSGADADEILLEDSAASYAKKRMALSDLKTYMGGLTDTNAIHDNETGEVHALTEKASPADADELLLEDSAASYAKKRTTWGDVKTALGSVFSATGHTHAEADITDLDHFDASAIHDDETGEIHAVTAKTSGADADELLLEDSAASYAKKRMALSDLKTYIGASSGDDRCGDGSDGDVTISSNTTLTRDMNYNDLTIDATKILYTAGFEVRVKGTLVNNGTISAAGGAGGNASGATGGIAGVAPYTAARSSVGTPGGGGTGGTSGGTGANNGSAGAAGAVALSAVTAARIRCGSGGGGGGARGDPAGSGTAGSATGIGAPGGAGSAGGGSGDYSEGGGGGGAGGGAVLLIVRTINNAGTITAAGGQGGSAGGSRGGRGGGGGGGVIVILYGATTGSGLGTRTVAGGAIGSTGNSGAVAGTDGTSVAEQIA